MSLSQEYEKILKGNARLKKLNENLVEALKITLECLNEGGFRKTFAEDIARITLDDNERKEEERIDD